MGAIEITTHVGCPCRCVYCPQDVFLKKYEGEQQLSLENCKEYFSTIPENWKVNFAGFSEPLLAKEIVGIIDYLSSTRLVSIFTTLYTVDKSVVRKIFDRDGIFVRFHLPDTEGHTKMKLTKELIQNYKIAVRLLNKHGVSYQSCCWGTLPEELQFVVDSSTAHESNIYSLCYMSGNLDLDWLVPASHQGYPIRCFRDSVHHLMPNGDLALCCQDWSLETILGNLTTSTFGDILNSDKLKAIRGNMEEDYGEIICRRCTDAKKR